MSAIEEGGPPLDDRRMWAAWMLGHQRALLSLAKAAIAHPEGNGIDRGDLVRQIDRAAQWLDSGPP
jgi:hypothetical protein